MALVKVSAAGPTVASVASLVLSAIVTSAVGWLASATVNVAVPPASVVGPLIAETVNPTPSLSMFDRLTSLAFMPL